MSRLEHFAAGLGSDAERFRNVVIAPHDQERFARAYEAAPDFHPDAVPAYSAMREETKRQFDLLGRMGIEPSVQHEDPYASAGDMRHDVLNNRQIKVMSTATTGGHPFFTNDENDMFRAVHDVFGHVRTGRGFDRHGEEAAYQAHAEMYSPLARQALATETRGQNAHLIRRGFFGPQKIATLPGATRRLSAPAQMPELLQQARQFHSQAGLGKL